MFNISIYSEESFANGSKKDQRGDLFSREESQDKEEDQQFVVEN
jgi:hypothetical protein